MNYDEFLPEQMTVGVGFAAMAHFLALHFNELGGPREVADFIHSINADGIDKPASDEVFARFKSAVVFADRSELVEVLREPK